MQAGQKMKARYTVRCCVCAAPFKAKLSRAKYCSLKCKNAAARTSRGGRKCRHCKKKICAANPEQKYCSISCGLSASSPSRLIICKDCEAAFTYNGRGRCLRCPGCRKISARIRSYESQVRLGRIVNPGSGKGGNQFGENNHRWQGGHSQVYAGNYRTTCFRYWPRECAVCGRDFDIEVHHVDGNGKNNDPCNLVPLCHDHHWQVHARRNLTTQQLQDALESIFPNCRCKIAEKTGKPSGGQPELKAQARCND